MKKINITLLGTLATFLVACTDRNNYQVNISATDFANGQVYLVYVADTLTTMDSAAFDDKGIATLKGNRGIPLYCQVRCHKQGLPDRYIPLILEAGKINVNVDTDSVTGTEKNLMLHNFITTMNQFNANEEALFAQYMEASEARNEELCNTISNQYDKALEQKMDVIKKYILSNNQNVLGAVALYMNFKEISYMVEPQDLIAIIDNAGEEFYSQPQIASIVEYATRLKNVLPGAHFTDIEMLDLQGRPVRLSQFIRSKGYLVIDFWASWCGPCRRAMPALKEIYSTYKNHIDILGISLDKDEEQWKNAVQSFQLPWNHASDLNGWQSKAARTYCVNAIPHLLLIDSNGIIIARGLDDEMLKEKLNELIPNPSK